MSSFNTINEAVRSIPIHELEEAIEVIEGCVALPLPSG